MNTSFGAAATGVERLLHRPIFGGVFGQGRFALASMPCVSRGLHSIRYLVVEPRAGMVLSASDDKTEALEGARRVLRASNDLGDPVETDAPHQLEIWPDEPMPTVRDHLALHVSRRRRAIFEKCGGQCHYCGTTLTLDGKWHVEHMKPRALGGADELLNLVAACVPCNLGKSDLTAVEFVVQSQHTRGSPALVRDGS